MKELIFILVFSVTVGAVRAAQIVVPTSLTNADGNDSGGFQSNGQRLQQIYGASLFSSLAQEPISISAVKFRVDPNAGIALSATPEMEVRLSTTVTDPNSLTSFFQANAGDDVMVALPRSTLSLQGNPGLSFDVVIPLPNHFVYDRSRGNLLVDFFVYKVSGLGISLDVQNQGSDSISILSGAIGDESGSRSSAGFVTAFVYAPVPEPHLMALVMVGTLLIFRRKNVIA